MTIDWKKILAVVGGLVVLGALAYGVLWLRSKTTPNDVPPRIQNGTSTVAEIDISGWNTYRNDELGFEFRYPEDWILEEKEDSVRVSNGLEVTENDLNAPDYFSVYVVENENPELLTAYQLVEREREEWRSNSGYYLHSISTTTIDGKQAAGLSLGECLENCGKSFNVARGSDVYEVDYDIYSRADNSLRVLSTFKFIEPEVDTSGWKTYRLKDIEFKYPPQVSIYGPLISDASRFSAWIGRPSLGGGGIVSMGAADIAITVWSLKDEPLSQILKDDSIADTITKASSSVVVAGNKALRVDYVIPFSDFSYVNKLVYLVRGETLYKFSLIYEQGDSKATEFFESFNQILNTVGFVK